MNEINLIQSFLKEQEESNPDNTYKALKVDCKILNQYLSEKHKHLFGLIGGQEACEYTSFATMVMTTVAARCERKSTYKYKTPDIPDLTALHLLKTKEDVVKLCGTVHNSAHSILSKMERSITQIINIKKEERHNEHNQAGNKEAWSR